MQIGEPAEKLQGSSRFTEEGNNRAELLRTLHPRFEGEWAQKWAQAFGVNPFN